MATTNHSSPIKPILALEINEVPWEVLNHYSNLPNIKKLLDFSHHVITENVDQGELSPWVTWPTIHRGLTNREHGIANIGQDPKTYAGTPIWEEYLKRGHSVGVFLPFQSFPPPYPGKDGFFVPDTFAPTDLCYPPELSLFQKLNLFLVNKNTLVRQSDEIFSRPLKLLSFVPSLFFLVKNLSFRTWMLIFQHLFSEFVHPHKKEYRPLFQTLIAWDLFKKYAFTKAPLPYMSFFTNHLAGIMHRYWRDIFPEQWRQEAPPHKPENKQLMNQAMNIFDQMLEDIFSYQQKYPELNLVLLSSMGQKVVDSYNHLGCEALWRDPSKMMSLLGYSPQQYKLLSAMHPQVTLHFSSQLDLNTFLTKLQGLKTESMSEIFDFDVKGTSVTLSTKNLTTAQVKIISQTTQQGPWSSQDFGLELITINGCTAYHCPEGVMLLLSSTIPQNLGNRLLSHEIKGQLLKMAGLIQDKDSTKNQVENFEVGAIKRTTENTKSWPHQSHHRPN